MESGKFICLSPQNNNIIRIKEYFFYLILNEFVLFELFIKLKMYY